MAWVLVALGALPLVTTAATISVTSPGDTDPTAITTCTLRQAITAMNQASVVGTGCVASGTFGSHDTITFDTTTFPPTQPSDYPSGLALDAAAGGQLDVTDAELVIDGTVNGTLRIDAASGSRILHVHPAASQSSLTLKHLQLNAGSASSSCGTSAAAGPNGGAICAPHTDLTLIDSSNYGATAPAFGGAIYSEDGNVTLINTWLERNKANIGGAVFVRTGSVSLIRATVRGNYATQFGGAIETLSADISLTDTLVNNNAAYSGGGLYTQSGDITAIRSQVVVGAASPGNGGNVYSDSGAVTLINSTLAQGSGGLGGALYAGSGAVRLVYSTVSQNNPGIYAGGSISAVNSIIAGNTGSDLAGAATLSPTSHNNLLSGDPMLTLSGNYWLVPQAGSPAIDAAACHDPNAVVPDGLPIVDARLGVRPGPGNSACDIGAIEVGAVANDYIFADGFERTP